jgi:hypothetical protein
MLFENERREANTLAQAYDSSNCCKRALNTINMLINL